MALVHTAPCIADLLINATNFGYSMHTKPLLQLSANIQVCTMSTSTVLECSSSVCCLRWDSSESLSTLIVAS